METGIVGIVSNVIVVGATMKKIAVMLVLAPCPKQKQPKDMKLDLTLADVSNTIMIYPVVSIRRQVVTY